ncbi:MAG: thioredoxin domain-containing protein, partial [Nocardioides sp.]|nr:thioredoxin domain-containing protein [Nocardioides sp.]
TADFLLRELRTEQGGFASALDADSEGVEGKFYAWTPLQLLEVLGPEDAVWAGETFEVTAAGTFEHGASTLQLLREPDDAERFARVRSRLFDARATRIRPARDDKVVAAWNGLAISSLCAAGRLLGVDEYVDAARAAAHLVVDVHLTDDGLRRVSRDGVVGRHAAVLEDHGALALGLLDLAAATAEAEWLEVAGDLLDVALRDFRADDGGFHDTSAAAEELVARPRDPSDNASPSGLSSTAQALSTYAALTGSGRHRQAAEEALASVATLMERAPRFAGWSLAAAQSMLDGPLEIAVVGKPGAERDALAHRALRRPGAVVVVAEPGVEGIPLLEGRGEVDDRPAAYVCRGMVCERPVTEPDDIFSS